MTRLRDAESHTHWVPSKSYPCLQSLLLACIPRDKDQYSCALHSALECRQSVQATGDHVKGSTAVCGKRSETCDWAGLSMAMLGAAPSAIIPPATAEHVLHDVVWCKAACSGSPVMPLQDKRRKGCQPVRDGPADRGAHSASVTADGLPLIHSHPLVVVVHLKHHALLSVALSQLITQAFHSHTA